MTRWSETLCFCFVVVVVVLNNPLSALGQKKKLNPEAYILTGTGALGTQFIHNSRQLCSIIHTKPFIFPLRMHYTLQQRGANEGIFTGLFQGCSFTLVVCASVALICTAGGRAATRLLHSLYSAERLKRDRKNKAEKREQRERHESRQTPALNITGLIKADGQNISGVEFHESCKKCSLSHSIKVIQVNMLFAFETGAFLSIPCHSAADG